MLTKICIAMVMFVSLGMNGCATTDSSSDASEWKDKYYSVQQELSDSQIKVAELTTKCAALASNSGSEDAVLRSENQRLSSENSNLSQEVSSLKSKNIELEQAIRNMSDSNGAVAQPTTDSRMFYLKTDDNEEACSALVSFMEGQGLNVKKIDDGIALIQDDHKYLLLPKVNLGGLSRIVIQKIYEIEEEYRGTPDITALLGKLNQTFNVAIFYTIDEDTFVMQNSVTFVDQVPLVEIVEFARHLESSLNEIKSRVPEMVQCLK